MSYRLLNLKKPKLFKPKFSRGDPTLVYADSPNNLKIKGTIGDSASTASFRYSANRSLKSTQELNIDYSYFENHTFFDSALSKTNIAFDKIINKYPFDGTLKSIEEFEDQLTGFENWVLDSYPKTTGSLHLSGTAINEDPAHGYLSGLGQFIIVKDGSGLEFPGFSNTKTALPVLDPDDSPFSIEFFIKLPEEANNNQIIAQKNLSISKNITLALESSGNTEEAGLKFGLTFGSDYLFASGALPKGSFNHLSAQFDRSGAQHKLNVYLNGQFLTGSAEQFEMSSLDFENADLLIGSGSAVRINEQIFTPVQTLSASIDEFRFFHSTRKPSVIASQMYSNIYASEDLKLYYKFNEINYSHSLKDVVLDSSGNSLHSKIQNYTSNARSLDNPVTAEDPKRNPVLYYVDKVDDLYQELINSASFYDEFNPNLITKLFPAHYFLEGDDYQGYDFNNPLSNLESTPIQYGLPGTAKFGTTQLLISFILIWAKFFDELKLFVDAFGDVRDINYESEDTVADTFLHSLADYYNIDLPDLFPNANLNQLVDGTGIYSSFATRSEYTLAYIQNQIWRRILTNAVHINKSNGTIEGLRSIMRIIGINVDDIFTLREYGGQSQITLDGIRVNKTDNLRLLSFTGSLSSVVDPEDVNAQGYHEKKPKLIGAFLTASRVEVGSPPIQGTFVNKNLYPPHGISNNSDDGLLTSGSFTFEGVYRFPSLLTGSYPEYQSLARIHVTGSDNSSLTEGVTTNLVLKSGSITELHLYARPGSLYQTDNSVLLAVPIYSASIFDGGLWNISFGRRRGDLVDVLKNEEKSTTSSYFLRVGKCGDRRLDQMYIKTTKFLEGNSDHHSNVFQVTDSQKNSSGSFIVIGSQSLETAEATSRFLNNTFFPHDTRTTNFAGEAGLIRFWSEKISETAWKEHVRNPTSVGVDDPTINYNFLLHNTGTFEQMRVYTIAKQATTESDSSGEIRFFDFSQNNLHLAGSGFEANNGVFKANQLRYSTLNPQFDVLGTTEKVRIRSIQDTDRLLSGGYPYATTAPAYNVPEREEVFDDLRFSLEMSLVKALNEDIVNIFSDYQFIENSLGRPNLLFAEKYPALDQVRKNYFENVTDKLDVEKYYKLFKWFNDTFTSTIERMLPTKTKFMGVNFVIESHALERHKFKYYYDEIYLKALQRDPNRGTIYLSQFVGNIKKF